ncbi:hypothetical protein niasHT_022062 [Heterodera trifolii]|uniref:G-protein coupled receptors family 1 profile domain-containing protein n=1 Tax=Heterodera trifolii TaxID=157864 RepID=A0ABD2JJF5_9BILA
MFGMDNASAAFPSSSSSADQIQLDFSDSVFDLSVLHLPSDVFLRHHNLSDLHHLAVAHQNTRAQQMYNMEAGLDPFLVVKGGVERAVVLAYFLPLMLIGIIGNSWLIMSVVRVLSHQWLPINLLFRQISLYILTLAIVDLAVDLSIPMLVSYTLSSNWQFGTVGCKLFFAIENVNKLLSVMVLASMSVERFVAVCRPLQWLGIRISQKRLNNAFALLGLLLGTVAILCTPMIYFAQANHYMLIFPDESVEMEDATCGSQLPDRLLPFFISYMLLFGFIVPLPLIAICYFFIIRHLRRKPRGSVTYTARAVRSILRVVIFHFICWTPFWLFVLLPLLSHLKFVQMDTFLNSHGARIGRMLTCFLPYLNSSMNWIFYGMMNRQLRETGAVTGRRSCMPLSATLRTTRTTSTTSKRSIRSLIASSRV